MPLRHPPIGIWQTAALPARIASLRTGTPDRVFSEKRCSPSRLTGRLSAHRSIARMCARTRRGRAHRTPRCVERDVIRPDEFRKPVLAAPDRRQTFRGHRFGADEQARHANRAEQTSTYRLDSQLRAQSPWNSHASPCGRPNRLRKNAASWDTFWATFGMTVSVGSIYSEGTWQRISAQRCGPADVKPCRPRRQRDGAPDGGPAPGPGGHAAALKSLGRRIRS